MKNFVVVTFLTLPTLLFAPATAFYAKSSAYGPSGREGDTTFTPTATYFMSPTGNDNADGLTSVTAWASPNHSLHCGDAIIAAPGAYSNMWGSGNSQFGTVSNCPSTTGGIDDTGGVNFAILLCGGGDLGADGCSKTSGSPRIATTTGNWAIEGWTITPTSTTRAFEVYACSTVVSYVAFINDIAINAGQGYDTNDCGKTGGPNTYGGDYFAVVGSIAQDAAQDPICLAAIDSVGPGQLNSKSGTHVYFYGDFSYAHKNSSCRNVSDTEDYMFDTWDAHAVTYQGVLSNSMGWGADRMGVHIFWQNKSTASPTIKISNNTFFQNNAATGSDYIDGEINIAATKSGIPWNISITNNIALQTLAISSGGKPVASEIIGKTFTGMFENSANLMRANQSRCKGAYCNSTYDAQSFGNRAELNTSGNTYADPFFANTSDLLTNWVGAPNCTGFENVTQCMGYDAYTLTLKPLTPISDLTPNSMYTKAGYQTPSTVCNANPDYPTWLKGIVYLHWNGTSIVQSHGLVTTPCGL